MHQLTDASPEELRVLVDRGEFFWLDLVRPTRERISGIAEAIGVDPEAAVRALRFGDVPELRLFRGHAGLVFYGAQPTGAGPAELVEVHVYVSGSWVVSIREGPCLALEQLHDEFEGSPPADEEAAVARVLGALAESFEELMDPLDEQIERLEEAAAEESRPAGQLRREMLDHRGKLARASRLVRRQRDYIERAVGEIPHLPGLESGERHELRDVAGRMILVADRIDDALHRLSGALDVLNATVGNRLNWTMERLTVVATIFLPLTVVTGFFGQNFGWMLDHIDSLTAFLLGVVLLFVSGLGIYLWVRERVKQGRGEIAEAAPNSPSSGDDVAFAHDEDGGQ
jgi:magnesium transporter